MDNSKYAQLQSFNLAGSGCISGATSITLNSMLQIDGVTPVTMTNFGDKGFATIEPGNSTREEQISFTGIVQNSNGTATLTGVSHVLFVSPYTETSGTNMSHPGGVTLVISNTSGFYNRFANKEDDETIDGSWTFSTTSPTIPTATSGDIHEAASIEYVNDIAISGAPNATTSVKGIVQLATQAQIDAKTGTGSTGAALVSTPTEARSTLLSDYVADTGTANTYVITPAPAVSAYTTGQIFSFKALHANTSASTLNVNALGAKTIKNTKAGDLVANDILLGQIVVVEYDGTNFQMVSTSGNLQAKTLQSATTIVDVSAATAPSSGQILTATSSTAATWQPPLNTLKGVYSSGTTTRSTATASGTQAIAHGLGTTPLWFNVSAMNTIANNNVSMAVAYGANTISYNTAPGGTFGSSSATFTVYNDNAGNSYTGTLSADATNINIVWGKSGTPSNTVQILWQAFA